jgi:hypothetical protein
MTPEGWAFDEDDDAPEDCEDDDSDQGIGTTEEVEDDD